MIARPLRHIAVSLSFAASAAAAVREASKLFTDQTWRTFRESESAKARIDMDRIDDDLLSAAVIHETNMRRENEGLPTLLHYATLREVAPVQAKIMAGRGTISHVSPKLPAKEMPADRFRLAGLNLAFAAESVATAFGLDYTSGAPVNIREETGRKLFSPEPQGVPLKMHTYITFAEDLLEGWTNSPGHRANIVSTDPQCLGASCRPSINDIGIPMFYGAQEFYTPPPAR